MREEDGSGRSRLLWRVRVATTARIQFMMRLAKHRKGSILAVVVLSVLAAVALYWARDTDQYEGNLLLNIGASFVGAVVTYALINPLMSRAESREEKILDRFDHANVIQRINDSKSIVRIFETGVVLLDEPHRRNFLTACRAALNGGVKVEILLLHPDCPAALQRAEELGSLRGSSLDLRSLISENLLHLREFDIKPRVQGRFEVKVYATSPLAAYYRWDRRAQAAFFPPTGSSVHTTQYEISVDSNFAKFVEERFKESWDAPNTYTLQQYFELVVKIIRDGAKPESLVADWMALDDRIYLANPKLTSYAVESGQDRLQVRFDPVESHLMPFAEACGLALCDAESPAHLSFNRKYGPEPGRTILQVLPGTDGRENARTHHSP